MNTVHNIILLLLYFILPSLNVVSLVNFHQLGYKPVGGDLAYPEKLVLARKIGIGLERGISESTTPLSEVASVSSIGEL